MERKYFVNSGIIGVLVSGLLINWFFIYVGLVFHEGDYKINKILFIICGILFLAFLVYKSIKAFQKIKCGESSVGKLLKEMILTMFFSGLWIIFFYMILEFADNLKI